MDCPKCGHEQEGNFECEQCGIIFKRFQQVKDAASRAKDPAHLKGELEKVINQYIDLGYEVAMHSDSRATLKHPNPSLLTNSGALKFGIIAPVLVLANFLNFKFNWFPMPVGVIGIAVILAIAKYIYEKTIETSLLTVQLTINSSTGKVRVAGDTVDEIKEAAESRGKKGKAIISIYAFLFLVFMTINNFRSLSFKDFISPIGIIGLVIGVIFAVVISILIRKFNLNRKKKKSIAD